MRRCEKVRAASKPMKANNKRGLEKWVNNGEYRRKIFRMLQ